MSERPPLPVRLLPHLFLIAILGVEVLAWTGWHRGEEELEVLASSGTPRERVWAMHVLTNRDPASRPYRSNDIRALLDDPDPLVVDLAYTIDFCRLSHLHQETRISRRLRERAAPGRRDEVPDWWRRFLLYRRKVGGFRLGSAMRLQHIELAWYYDALAGRPLDEDELIQHVFDRKDLSLVVQELREQSEEDE